MKKTTLILVIFFFLGTISNSIACSPATTPFKELLTSYNQNNHIIVEGYFLPEIESRFTSKFKVTRSSDSSIQIGQEYEVYEYGPFGNECEGYQMRANVEPQFVRKDNTRLLFVYKDKSTNGKLVTPIFWAIGAKISNNKIKPPIGRDSSGTIIHSEFPVALDEFWKQISEGEEENLTTETQEQDTESPDSSENWFMKLYKSLTE